MKTLILKVLCTFYNYYNKGSTKMIAYESAILAVLLLLFINFATIFSIYNYWSNDFIKLPTISRMVKYIVSIIALSILLFIFKKIFSEDEIVLMGECIKNNPLSKYILLIYVILSVVLFLVVVLKAN